MKPAHFSCLEALVLFAGMGLLQSCSSGSGAAQSGAAASSTSSSSGSASAATLPANTLLCNNTASPAVPAPCPLYSVAPEAYGAVGDGKTDDTKSIQSAIAAASTAGGGVVALRAVTYYVPGGLTLAAGVHIHGLGCNFDSTPFGAYVSGTRLLGNNTSPGVSYVPTQFSSQPAEPAALAEGLYNAGVENLCIDSATYGLEFGALFNSGLFYGSDIQNVAVMNASVWGVYCENCSEVSVATLYNFFLKQGAIGQMYFGASQSNYTNGNYTLQHIYADGGNYSGQRGIVFQARAGSQLNDVNVFDIEATQTGYAGGQVQPAAMATGSVSIQVTNGSYFPVDMPVTFCTTANGNANGFVCNQTYFVVAQSGNAIQVGAAQRDIAIAASGNAPVNIITYGWPGIEVAGYRAANDPNSRGVQSQIQGMTMQGVDDEGDATTLLLAQQAHLSLSVNYIGGGGSQGSGYAAELTARYMQGDYQANNQIVADTDQFSWSWYAVGTQLAPAPVANSAPQFLPQGIFTSASGSPALNIAPQSLVPTLITQSLFSSSQGYNPVTYPGVAMGQKTQAVTVNGAMALGSANTGSIVFATNDTKTVTLPLLDGRAALANTNTWAGAPYEIVNGGTGLITVTAATGQYFNRNSSLAVGGLPSLGLLPYVTLTLRAHFDGTASFWEIVGMTPSLFRFSAAGVPLPACAAALSGQSAIVSDAASPAYNSAYTSGGTVQVPVYCDGTNWTTH